MDGHKSAIQLQSMTSSGPLQFMDGIELEHWMRQACIRAENVAYQKLIAGLEKFEDGLQQEVQIPFQVRKARNTTFSELGNITCICCHTVKATTYTA